MRLGATWLDTDIIQQFMQETFEMPYYLRRSIEVKYSPYTAEWRINGKTNPSYNDVAAYVTYGTDRANAYKILEETLNLKDIRIYDTVEDAEGKKRRVLNKKETTLAQQKQQAIKDAFRDWVWKDPQRREQLVQKYNELFNSTRPREYDGSHIHFVGMNPDMKEPSTVATSIIGSPVAISSGSIPIISAITSCMERREAGWVIGAFSRAS